MGAAESPGRGGLRRLVLTAADGARAEVYQHGAHVTSWVPAGGDEQLFVSSRSEYRAGAAIRGGVPVIFPQFGPGPLSRHGFARTAHWEVAAAGAGEGGSARATLALRDSPATRALWPAAFDAELTVEVGGRWLAITFGVRNTGTDPLRFTAALHSYLAVGDLAGAAVGGLRGVRYRDQAAGGRETVDDAPAVRFAGEVDRLYLAPPAELRLRDEGTPPRTVAIRGEGFPDAVVWNPGADKAHALPDLGDEYRRMVCVEAAAAGDAVVVAPGARWRGTQRLTLLA
ncbi:MAG: hypothetical protein AVDCRST_MAG11-1811 [uncultured Gemmatimonadaceae bacterium]|uniref:Putative glucose-6-phosphate 1-epimerase n=1 Tax=uncultured Gemmatimonadaceae bacterium TaxID=246130 RepID=A0A6J4KVU6_9BACT|nr:MAG: hypothetical protein AVDCRST_MAG11-1811 [uncultured Gemmatimonadaceae bacterium]